MADRLKISLRAARVNAEMTMDEVSKQLHRGKKTISSWETGKTEPKASELEALCELYGLNMDDIFLPPKLT